MDKIQKINKEINLRWNTIRKKFGMGTYFIIIYLMIMTSAIGDLLKYFSGMEGFWSSALWKVYSTALGLTTFFVQVYQLASDKNKIKSSGDPSLW